MLSERERATLDRVHEKNSKRAHLKKLKRQYAKMIQHSDLVVECIELKSEIDGLERELAMM